MIGFFRRRRERRLRDDVSGNGTGDTKSLRKLLDAQNHIPVEYGCLTSFLEYAAEAPKIFKNKLQGLRVDSLNCDLFDALVDAESFSTYSSGKQQHEDHVLIIEHLDGLLQGELRSSELLLADLRADLEALDAELARLNELRREKENHGKQSD